MSEMTIPGGCEFSAKVAGMGSTSGASVLANSSGYGANYDLRISIRVRVAGLTWGEDMKMVAHLFSSGQMHIERCVLLLVPTTKVGK